MPRIILLIKITGKINSLDLWEHIKRYGVNLTDLEEFVYVMGETDIDDALKIIRICNIYGRPMMIELSEPH